MTEDKRYLGCRCWAVAGTAEVTVTHGGKGKAGFSGLQRCKSIWACPECAACILAGRAEELRKAVEVHASRGGAVVLMTMTVAHNRLEALETVSETERAAWSALTSDNGWKGRDGVRKRYGVSLAPIWGREITHGDNGWHPHRHVLLLLESPLSADELAAMQAEVYAIWRRKVTALGAKAPHPVRGVDVKQVLAGDTEGATNVAAYIAKGQLGGLAAEVTVGQFKGGRQGNRTPFQVLADIDAARRVGAETDPRDVAIWLEFTAWVAAGRRPMMEFPPRVKKALGVAIVKDEKFLADEVEALAAEDTTEEEVAPRIGVVAIPRDEFKKKLAKHLDRQDELLGAVARCRDHLAAGLAAVEVLERYGITYRLVTIPMDCGSGDDQLPTHTEALARDLAVEMLGVET